MYLIGDSSLGSINVIGMIVWAVFQREEREGKLSPYSFASRAVTKADNWLQYVVFATVIIFLKVGQPLFSVTISQHCIETENKLRGLWFHVAH